MKRHTHPWILAAVAMIAAAGTSMAGVALAAPDYLGVAPPKVHGEPASAGTVCAACHGAKGMATAPSFPNLAGQNYNYLLKALQAFRSGDWHAAPMHGIIATVPSADHNQHLKQLAAWFAQLELKPEQITGAQPNKAQAQAGYKLYFQGKHGAQVPACAACHLAGGMGNAPMAVPRLAGQNAAYIVSQLKAFASGKRRTAPDRVMHKIASRLSDKERQAVAAYVQAMRPDLLPVRGPKSYAAYVKALADQPVPGIPASALARPQDHD